MAFYILVDYDNLEDREKKRGLHFIVESILNKLSPAEILDKNVSVRLYGGWYDRRSHSSLAMQLISEISSGFPDVFTLSDNTTNVIANAELALSLNIEPTKLLFNTYRTRGMPSGLRCHHPTTFGCTSINCPALGIYTFISSNSCHECGLFKPTDFLYRGEQKLVDTMLTSDLISISRREKKVGIVSSDDDFWPGILTSISEGASIYHIHTKRPHTPLDYSSTITTNYYQRKL